MNSVLKITNLFCLLTVAVLALLLSACDGGIPNMPDDLAETPPAVSDEDPAPYAQPQAHTAADPDSTVSSTDAPEPAETDDIVVPTATEVVDTASGPFVYHGLVELLSVDDSFVIDQRYATTNNFTAYSITTGHCVW